MSDPPLSGQGVQVHQREWLQWLLVLAFLFLLCAGLYLIVRPFLEALIWAAILVLSTWPVKRWLSGFFPRHPTFVASVMTLLITLVIVAAIVPLAIKIGSEVERFVQDLSENLSHTSPQIPDGIRKLPWVGRYLQPWLETMLHKKDHFIVLLSEYRSFLFEFATRAAQGVVGVIIKFVLCLCAAFFMFLHGESASEQLTRALFRLGGDRCIRLLEAIRATVRAGVYGVLVTAFAQGVLAGIGYVAAGAPVPLLLGFATMIFSLIPFGTPLVYVPASLFLIFSESSWIPGALLLAWGIGVVSMADNILRPLFISQATEMPVLLVFMGVIGGVLGFGFLGLFIGPALFAVALVLWHEWIEGPLESERRG